MDESGNPGSLKERFKQSLCFSCCFRANRHQTLGSQLSSSSLSSSSGRSADNYKAPQGFVGASSQWIKTRAASEFPEMKDKCRNIFCRFGGNGKHNHQRRHTSSTDFRYDPLSYSLNFEDASCAYLDDEAPLKGFSSRLPPPSASTPPSLTTVAEQPHPVAAAIS